MTTQPFFFGRPDRTLLGLHHPSQGVAREAWLLCAPLLQDAVRCQRALWALATAMAAGDCDVLRFDWFGSGDSDGDSEEMTLSGMFDDLELARVALDQLSPGSPSRCLALRSAALPVLAHAARQSRPVHLLLWEPSLNGADLVATWRRQHVEQLQAVGRYLNDPPDSDPDELTGFRVGAGLLEDLSALDARTLVPPAGSRILVAGWGEQAEAAAYVAVLRAAGIQADTLALDPGDQPDFNDPRMFEAQAFPRRSVAQLARHVQGGVLA